MTNAISDEISVPNASGAMYSMTVLPPGRSLGFAVNAGQDLMIRKTATPASAARIVSPAPVARPENTRSPVRWGTGDRDAAGTADGCCSVRLTALRFQRRLHRR